MENTAEVIPLVESHLEVGFCLCLRRDIIFLIIINMYIHSKMQRLKIEKSARH
jgi:hypothetical protein